ncbi:hypothetical protein ACFYZ9_10920 [Streptomyces sp. NPDC001691]|uniref:hypothetical protein n=1 Tax=unclassified Streptomyces TaxID=2593676 RepID=UPI000DEBEE8E|nr:hypothetical protein [Streptomyces sp. SDr-06]RCH70027.1 hypothetical protein DT019_00455 [Streptomyces sp. SDr-06]
MRTLTRRLLLPGLTALALAGTGCSSPGHPAAAGPEGASSPAATVDGAQQLEVNAAPQGSAAPTPLARTRSGKGQPEKSSLKVASYDAASRRAVISTAPPSPTAKPSHSPTPGKPSDKPVAAGDIIASAPAPGAPNGLLAKVTEVVGTTDRGTEVKTAATTLASVLKDDKADGKVPVDPSSVTVVPLMKGVTFSWARSQGVRFGPQGAKLPLGNLRLDVNAGVETAKDAPASAAASVSGFVQLAPQVEFSYDGSKDSGLKVSSAFLGMSGDWSSQWALKGRAAASAGAPKRIPFAKLHSAPVIQVGPVPVVVNLDLTCYVQVEADGHVTLDVQQDVKGDFRVGGSYAAGKGWAPVSTSAVHSTPVNASVTAAGSVKGALGAEASVGLYGAVGVTADFAPYLRGEADAKATASSDGKTSASASWAAYGGFDLNGRLDFHLSLFGTPVIEHRIPLGSLHREWPLANGHVGR